jgi:hypothetical protein
MKHTKKVEALRRNLPESEEVECKVCGKKFYDEFNLVCLGALDMCLLCANRNLDKETIKEKYHE